METMLNVTVNGTIHQYPYGTTYRAIAAEFQENYPHQILLVNRDGKLRELQKTVKRDCSLSMVTAADKPGRQTYERSAILLMLKAFYDVVGREQVEHVRVEFSLSNALSGQRRFCSGWRPAAPGRRPDAGAGPSGPAHRKAVCGYRRRRGLFDRKRHGG